ncbi:MAG: hypothetical protein ACLP50_06125 [Solirubrobacteraceae bacterium]
MKHQSKSGLRVFVRGRWSRAAIGAGAVLGAVSAVGVFAVPVAGAPSTSGKLTISGATQGSWELTNGNQCSVSRSGPIQIKLDGTVVTNPVTNELGGSYPTLTIGQWKRNAPTHAVNLAQSKTYDIGFEDIHGTSWVSGWIWLGGSKFKHFGSGTLTIAKSGKSGTIRTEVVYYSGPNEGKVDVKASWNCA